MKPATFIKGSAAFDCFRDAMKVIVRVPKDAVGERLKTAKRKPRAGKSSQA